MDIIGRMQDIRIKIHNLEVKLEKAEYELLAGYNINYDYYLNLEQETYKKIGALKEELNKLEEIDKKTSIKKIEEMGGLL